MPHLWQPSLDVARAAYLRTGALPKLATPDWARGDYLTMSPVCGNIKLLSGQQPFQCEKREYWRLWEIYAALDNFDNTPTRANLEEVIRKKRQADRFFCKPTNPQEGP